VEPIQQGDEIEVRDVHGRWLQRKALTGVVDGHDFRVVWACRAEEWQAAEAEQRDPEGVPWPAEDVRLLQAVPS
jgi:hypothetical protein